MYDRETIEEVATRLEELTIIAKQIIIDLRDDITEIHQSPPTYTRVYYLRREMSRLAARLGSGVPSGLTKLESRYEQLVQQ